MAGIILSTLYVLSYTVLLRTHEVTTLIIFPYKPRRRVSDLPKIKITWPINKEPKHAHRSAGPEPTFTILKSLHAHSFYLLYVPTSC